jgi:hypothetical protein
MKHPAILQTLPRTTACPLGGHRFESRRSARISEVTVSRSASDSPIMRQLELELERRFSEWLDECRIAAPDRVGPALDEIPCMLPRRNNQGDGNIATFISLLKTGERLHGIFKCELRSREV